jgi:hypothetical protein
MQLLTTDTRGATIQTPAGLVLMALGNLESVDRCRETSSVFAIAHNCAATQIDSAMRKLAA